MIPARSLNHWPTGWPHLQWNTSRTARTGRIALQQQVGCQDQYRTGLDSAAGCLTGIEECTPKEVSTVRGESVEACNSSSSLESGTSRSVENMANTNLILNNNVTLPVLGFGVFQTPADPTAEAVAEALRVGYRHVDTAAAYGNEKGVGEALAAADVPRDEVFVETKLWISDYGYDAALHGFEKSAAKLNVDYIDLLLLHQPLTSNFDLTLEAYRALESLYTS